MKKVRISPSLIRKLIESGDILTFCYFIKLKYKHSNSTIYNYSIRKLSKLIDVSPNCMKVHLNKMKELGIVRVCKNKNGKENITFVSMSKVSKIFGIKHNSRCGSISFHELDKAQSIKTRLYSKILVNNLNKQKFSIKQKSDSLMRKKDQADKLKQNGKTPNHVIRSLARERISFDTFLCCDTIGKMFGATKMTGHNQLFKMVNMGLLTANKKFITILKNTTKEEFERLCDKGELIKGKYYFNALNSCIVKNSGFVIKGL